MSLKYTVVQVGKKYNDSFKLFFKNVKTQEFVSPFHDIDLYADKNTNIFNMVVEIPRWSNAKMEMATKEFLNPIQQDIKNGLPRFVHNIFPHHGYPWNYGALPQTWENPEIVDPHCNSKGDNDPIDVIEIGSSVLSSGDVVQVKVLGCIALLDEGETDWKIIAIRTEDKDASVINSIEDVEKHKPGLMTETIRWLRCYKVPAGKGLNSFGLDGKIQNAEFAFKIIEETNGHWQEMMSGKVKSGLSLKSAYTTIQTEKVSLNDTKNHVDELVKKLGHGVGDIPKEADIVYFV